MNRPRKKNHTQLRKLIQKNYLKSSISFHEKKKNLSKVEIEGKLFKLLTSIYKNKQKTTSSITMVKDGFNNSIKKCTKDLDILPKRMWRWQLSTYKDVQHQKPLRKCKFKPQWETTAHLFGELLKKIKTISNAKGNKD